MFDVFDFTPMGPEVSAARGEIVPRNWSFGPQATRNRAIELLRERGFVHLGDDPVGLPCFRSPTGTILIAVGSCRSLAYAKVGSRLQVVAAARTAALICRIAPVTGPAEADEPVPTSSSATQGPATAQEPWYKMSHRDGAVS